MKIEVTGRQGFAPTEAIRDYAIKRLTKVVEVFGEDVVHDIRVVGKVYRTEHVIEVTIRAQGVILRTEARDDDMYAAIDKATDKLITQVRKNKDKLRSKLERQGVKQTYSQEFDQEVEQPRKGVVVKNKKYELNPISKEEAILELELVGHDFYVFLDKDTNKTSVIYKRLDGDYAIIETE